MLASKNILPAITHSEGALPWIDLLAGELAVRLREARDVEPGLWPKTLVLSYRVGYSYANTRSRQLPFPFTRHLTNEYVAKYGRRMWRGVMASVFYTKGIQVTNVSGPPQL
jgi:DNA polymerase eta